MAWFLAQNSTRERRKQLLHVASGPGSSARFTLPVALKAMDNTAQPREKIKMLQKSNKIMIPGIKRACYRPLRIAPRIPRMISRPSVELTLRRKLLAAASVADCLLLLRLGSGFC